MSTESAADSPVCWIGLEVVGPGGLGARDRVGSNSAAVAAQELRIVREPLFAERMLKHMKADD